MHINCDLTFDRFGKFSHYFKEYDAALLRLALLAIKTKGKTNISVMSVCIQ